MTDGARDELRELLFDGVAPPLDTDAMFERTFAATGDDGAHLLPPDDLFDGADDTTDDLPLEDLALDDATLLDDGSVPDLGDGDAAPDDLADPTVDWPDPADGTPGADAADPGTPDVPFDHPASGW